MRAILFIAILHAFSSFAQQHPDSLIKQCESHFYTDPQKALVYAEEGIIVSQQQGNLKAEMRCQFLKGAYHFTQGEFDICQTTLHTFLKGDSSKTWDKLHPRVHSWLCHINMLNDNWREALEHAITGEKEAIELKDTVRMIEHLSYQGEIYRNIEPNNWERPLKYQEKALAIALTYGDPTLIQYGYNYIGAIHAYAKHKEEALEAFNEVITMSLINQDSFALAQVYHNISMLYETFNDLDSAITYNQKAIQCLTSQNIWNKSDDILASCYRELSDYYMQLGDFELAQAYFDSTKDIQLYSPKFRSDMLKTEAALLFHDGSTNKAYTLLKEHVRLRDSVKNAEIYQHAIDLLTWYETEKKEKDIALLSLKEKQNQLHNLQLEQRNDALKNKQLILILSITILVVLVLGLVLWFRQREKSVKAKKALLALEVETQKRERERLASDLEVKKNSLVSYSLLLSQKNETLLKLKKTFNSDYTTRDLTSLIDRSMLFENEWTHFMDLFEDIHPQFFQKISDHGDSITQNDLRLSALLKLGLTSKEIANILNLEPRSVDMSRHRLRKKMNLSNEVNLTEYIQGTQTLDEVELVN